MLRDVQWNVWTGAEWRQFSAWTERGKSEPGETFCALCIGYNQAGMGTLFSSLVKPR
jgi:hypothetical protein